MALGTPKPCEDQLFGGVNKQPTLFAVVAVVVVAWSALSCSGASIPYCGFESSVDGGSEQSERDCQADGLNGGSSNVGCPTSCALRVSIWSPAEGEIREDVNKDEAR